MHAPRTNHTFAVIAGCLLLRSAAPAEAQLIAPNFVYDTTTGATCTYTGDLTAGMLSFNHIDGRNFRVRRIGPGGTIADHGFFGVGGASLSANVNLVEFNDNTPDGSGTGDVAVFTGVGSGTDLVIFDEFGNSIQASIVEYQLEDDTSSLVRPGVVGAGVLSDVVFSMPGFQNVCGKHLQSGASLYTFTFVIETVPGDPVTLEEYLASSGLGGLAVEVEHLDVSIGGSECWGDFDGDNDIDQSDLGQLLASYEQDDGGDLDCDGDTDQSDLGVFLANYGIDCP